MQVETIDSETSSSSQLTKLIVIVISAMVCVVILLSGGIIYAVSQRKTGTAYNRAPSINYLRAIESSFDPRKQSKLTRGLHILTEANDMYKLRSQLQLERMENELRSATSLLTETLGPDDLFVGRAYHFLQIVWEEKKKYQAAADAASKAVDTYIKIGGNDSSMTATELSSAASYARLAGNNQQAEHFYRALLAIRQKYIGKSAWPTGKTASDIASVLVQEGKPEEAAPFFEQALAIHTRAKQSGLMREDLVNLAWIAEDQGDLAKALGWQKQLLELGDFRGTVFHNLAGVHCAMSRVYYKQGKYQDAMDQADMALDLVGKQQEYSRMARFAWLNKGRVFIVQHKYADARRCFDKSTNVHSDAWYGNILLMQIEFALGDLSVATGNRAAARRHYAMAEQRYKLLLQREQKRYEFATVGSRKFSS